MSLAPRTMSEPAPVLRGRSPVPPSEPVVHVRRQPNAPVNGNDSLQITSIYGFGTPAPDYLLRDHASEVIGTPTRKFGARASQRSSRSPNPIEWDENAPRTVTSSVTGTSRRRTASVPRSVVFDAAAPAAEGTASPKKRGTYSHVPGGRPYSFIPDPTVQDPLTVRAKKSADSGEVRYIGGDARRLKRTPQHRESHDDLLKWNEE
ncbi:hypothetical protein GGF32_008832 [Allomyces javanicus]|nr:hypothetical protein GGF32_008832 [Allomyces javanicus]